MIHMKNGYHIITLLILMLCACEFDENSRDITSPAMTSTPTTIPTDFPTNNPSITPDSTPSPVAVPTNVPTQTPPNSAIIADHAIINMVRYNQIPVEAIEQAKSKLHIAYDHTSHGSQIIGGMDDLNQFMENNGSQLGLYTYNDGGIDGALDLKDDFTDVSDLGYYPEWVYATRKYLGWNCLVEGDYSAGTPAYNSDYNVIIWSWCYLYAAEASINDYLAAMIKLIEDYPQVNFVFMTAHANGTGESGPVHYWNRYIRQFCIDNNLILYDFYDIELYDPDGNYFGDKRVTDECYYDNDPPYDSGELLGNWAIEWQNYHIENTDWYPCYSPHSQPVNANMKAYAAWWLFARLGGWDGTLE